MDEEKKKQINDAILLMQWFCEEFCTVDGFCDAECPMFRNCGERVVAWNEID